MRETHFLSRHSVMIIPVLLLLSWTVSYAKPYPLYQTVVREMEEYVALMNNEGVENITAKSVPMGNSTQSREMRAFCFGNCERGIYSVFSSSFHHSVVSPVWRHPRSRRIIRCNLRECDFAHPQRVSAER